MSAAPLASVDRDRARRAQLRRMRRRAGSLLVMAAAVLVAARRAEDGGAAWTGYVRAAAEAALVGGLADWFAVTALFRRPGGLPIPHTAVIVTRKDRIGASLAGFVQANFLSGDLVADRLRAAGPTRRVARALSEPATAARVAQRVTVALADAAERVDVEATAAALERPVRAAFSADSTVAALAGAAADLVVDGRHHRLVDDALAALDRYLVEHRGALRRGLGDRSPWWVPAVLDDRVFAQLHDAARSALAEVAAEPHHPARRALDSALTDWLVAWRDDPARRAASAGSLVDALDTAGVASMLSSLVAGAVTVLRTEAGDPGSELRRRVEVELGRWADRVLADDDMASRLDERVATVAGGLLDRNTEELASMLESTVAAWDASEVSDQLELVLGPDLQFIRINGTVVGAVIGLVLHGLGELVA